MVMTVSASALVSPRMIGTVDSPVTPGTRLAIRIDHRRGVGAD
jgi:hypothetical protein